jgi:hypothetical protein
VAEVKLKRSLVVVLALGGLTLGATGALAGGPVSAGVPIAFVIPAGHCSQISDPALVVTGEGTRYVSVDGKGRIHTNVRGTATDNKGGSYVFNYTNQNDALFDPGYAGPYPVVITMTDHFNLVGNGAGDKIQAHFAWRIQVNGPFDPFVVTWDEVFFHGQGGSFEGCDPI